MKRKPTNVITKVRTGSGDSGMTQLGPDMQVSKASCKIRFVGLLDKACSSLGPCNVRYAPNFSNSSGIAIDQIGRLDSFIRECQNMLFTLGAMCHNPALINEHQHYLDNFVVRTEKLMDDSINDENSNLRGLEGFIVPNSANHFEMTARADIRIAESMAVECNADWAIPVLNTMSDYMFLIAWINSGYHFTQWKGIPS